LTSLILKLASSSKAREVISRIDFGVLAAPVAPQPRPRCPRATSPGSAWEYAHLSWRRLTGAPATALKGRAKRFCVSSGVTAA
jgi:hypothetical protein